MACVRVVKCLGWCNGVFASDNPGRRFCPACTREKHAREHGFGHRAVHALSRPDVHGGRVIRKAAAGSNQ